MTGDYFTAYRQRRFFTSLDGIRCFCILAVIWHHTVQPTALIPISSRGFLGVDMFFVVSGYLIVTLLLRENDRNGDISLQKFYMRRTLRIFPVYYGLLIALSILFFIVAPGGEIASDFRSNLPFYATYTSNWIHDTTMFSIHWSLATEEQFYLVWPALQKFLKNLAIPFLIVFIVFNQLINYGIIFPEAHARLEILQSTFTPISFGVLLAYAMHSQQSFNALFRAIGQRWMPIVLTIAMLVVLNWPPLGSDISGTTRLLGHILMTLLLASCTLREDHVLQSFFTLKPIARLGIISYGVYLFHMLVRHASGAVLARIGLDGVPLTLFVVTLVGTVIVAELSFRFYEKPFLKLKNRWATVPTRPEAQPTD